jgi:hypothetical protein
MRKSAILIIVLVIGIMAACGPKVSYVEKPEVRTATTSA